MNIFEQASRVKLRFSTSVGNLSVEDLWELPITSNRGANLKDLAIAVQSKIAAVPVSALDFLDSSNVTVDPIIQLQFDIIKHIIVTKQSENKAKSEEKAKENHRAEIQELIKLKKQEQLSGKSLEELEAMLG